VAPGQHVLAASVLLILATACGGPADVPILLWHSVGEGDDPRDVYDLTPTEFDEQVNLITSTFRATPITLDQYFDSLERKTKLPHRAVILTFDDGRRSLYTVAFPILRKYGVVAENFVVTDYLADSEATRKKINGHDYLLWSEVDEMYKSGVMIPQSHTRSHLALREHSKMEQHREISGSRHVLRRRLGAPINFLAYPYGSFSPVSRQLAEEAGYRGALSVGRATGTVFDLPRTSLRRGSTPLLQTTLQQSLGK
jgi:peptidoglycan/xylan/chitin deacetylase (PgdA/CDA1 family)